MRSRTSDRLVFRVFDHGDATTLPPRGRRDGYIRKCVELRATPCDKDGARDRLGGKRAQITENAIGRTGIALPGRPLLVFREGRFASDNCPSSWQS